MAPLASAPSEPSTFAFNFPQQEEEILKFWKEIDAFRVSWWLTRSDISLHKLISRLCAQESIKQSEGKPKYSFFDGPPFATGLPHHGHILMGTVKVSLLCSIWPNFTGTRRGVLHGSPFPPPSLAGSISKLTKIILQDIVTRYAHSNGFHVERRFGWDTHGLPVEHEIDQKLNITSKADVLALGIDKYNDECRAIVMRYSSQWRTTVERLGRWIDFDNDYKTLNNSYMESVWWVFSELWKKDLVYQGLRVMPYSTRLTTPLSNFEATSAYRDISDPAG